MTESVTRKRNSLAKKISHGDVLNVYQGNGYAMAIQIVLTELMKMSQHNIAQHHNPVAKICLLVTMVVASTRAGSVIMTTIVETVLTKENSAIHNTKRVHHRNLLAKISNVSEINIDVTVRDFPSLW